MTIESLSGVSAGALGSPAAQVAAEAERARRAATAHGNFQLVSAGPLPAEDRDTPGQSPPAARRARSTRQPVRDSNGSVLLAPSEHTGTALDVRV